MGDVTSILRATGDGNSSEHLLPVVYEELRRLAAARLRHERPDNTLQPTALVHEAYLRLVQEADVHWEHRGHFFAAAALEVSRATAARDWSFARAWLFKRLRDAAGDRSA